MTRQQSIQGEPDPATNLSGFPAVPHTLDSVHRAHSRQYGPGWYACDGDGRFDLADPRGTLYSGDDVETATRERLGPALRGRQKISRELAEGFVVSEISLPHRSTFADLGSRTAARFNVIREMLVMTDYDITQVWANAFDQAGLDGVRYASRFTMGDEPNAWALFGPAGADPSFVPLRAVDGPTACAASGIDVVDLGPRAVYRVLD